MQNRGPGIGAHMALVKLEEALELLTPEGLSDWWNEDGGKRRFLQSRLVVDGLVEVRGEWGVKGSTR